MDINSNLKGIAGLQFVTKKDILPAMWNLRCRILFAAQRVNSYLSYSGYVNIFLELLISVLSALIDFINNSDLRIGKMEQIHFSKKPLQQIPFSKKTLHDYNKRQLFISND